MTGPRKLAFAAACSTLVFVGCASVPREAGFHDVQASVAERTGQRIRWNRLSADDQAAQAAVADLLAGGLTADAAVQVALLNNANLHAIYEELGVAQADVVQAGLLRNPVFDAEIKFGEGGSGTAVELAVVQDFLDVFLIPLRRRMANDAFEAAKLGVVGAVLDLAGEARAGFHDHEANERRLELRRVVASATAASHDLARRLREAGNNTELDVAQERALHEQAKVDLATAEAQVLDSRERLNVLMGLWGSGTTWTTAMQEPALPGDDHALTAEAERNAVTNSIALAIGRAEIRGAARSLGIRRSFGLIPEAEAGLAAEREEGEWAVGPAFSLPIPLFDQGQAATAAAGSRLRGARQRYIATAVEVRSAARAARNRLLAVRARADYYHQVILPLRREITERTQLQYNAMQIGAFQLLQAKQEEIEAGIAYIDALRDYWIARTHLEQITSGRLTDLGSGGSNMTSAPPTNAGGRRESGGH